IGPAPRHIRALRLQPVHIIAELVEASPRCYQIRSHPVVRSASSRWCQPTKVWGPASDRRSHRAAVGMPNYPGGKTNDKNHHDAGVAEREQLFERQPDSRDQILDE